VPDLATNDVVDAEVEIVIDSVFAVVVSRFALDVQDMLFIWSAIIPAPTVVDRVAPNLPVPVAPVAVTIYITSSFQPALVPVVADV
jgi:hypothetical protein